MIFLTETIPEKQPDKQSPAKLVTAEAEQVLNLSLG